MGPVLMVFLPQSASRHGQNETGRATKLLQPSVVILKYRGGTGVVLGSC